MKRWKEGVPWLFLGLFVLVVSRGKVVLWLVLYAASLPLVYFFGRIYCGYVCPMNTVMKISEKLAKGLRWTPEEAPKWLESGRFPWITLVASAALMIFSRAVLHKNIPILLLWLVISFGVTLRYKPSVFHNLICPFGVLQKVFSGKPFYTHEVDKAGCIGCSLCEKVCPSEAILVLKADHKAEIQRSLCLQCGSCVGVCPKDTIAYHRSGDRKQ